VPERLKGVKKEVINPTITTAIITAMLIWNILFLVILIVFLFDEGRSGNVTGISIFRQLTKNRGELRGFFCYYICVQINKHE